MARILTLTLNPALDLTVSLTALRLGEVNRSDGLQVHAAGKGLNVAQVLADLGHQLSVSGFLGEANADRFDALFAARGFDDAFIRVPGETRRNFKLAESAGRVTDINGQGPLVSEEDQARLLARLERIAPGHDAVVVAGSLPRGVSVTWFQQLLERLHALGLKVALDTSGTALRAGLATQPWLVKPNTEELAEVTGGAVETLDQQAQVAARLRAQGIANVVISQGAQGVNWFADGIALQGLPPTVDVASTVGAGDSLLAGMVHGLLSAADPEVTLRTATAIAAMAVTQIGFGIPDPEALARLQSGVCVRPLPQQQEA
ncbi:MULTISPECIES: 1-phosphofructokinase [unclassified Pseudomonas]|uniref:1-phosphofructokinase n=1 Tax=unclassified Pseudomonas TaxID=196821 RepID=UPI000BD60A75|nr:MULTISPECIES: 1-phosphofructokinase [unclassified Pseudomonas]PVZ12382.1 1-phosphofructokinase [Pseudomonas sp. URIL14HWK12:I12]PVZ23466.1 1-phosphofructokinase [Pseudomonas sp. URIL14HWK12:I10]PVZ32796.1 1-phosphofructokinase [Pseudomonas sp. URIL14HWK12:I11]SNZ14114.1 1-phosphofructokinase [Pseudomonas sp. URIL14HWK12:I9]